MKNSQSALLLILLAAILTACSKEKEEQIWNPHVVKYLYNNTNNAAYLVRVDGEPYAEDWNKTPPERRKISWHQERWNPDPSYGGMGWSDHHTAFAQILQANNIVVSNALVANDIKCLVDEVMRININSEFLVDSITCSQSIWSVESRYYGGPDDWHRRPSKVITKIYTDGAGVITNIIKDVYPRPMDLRDTEQEN